MEIIIRQEENGLSVKEYLYKVLKLSTAAVKRVKYRERGILVNGENVTVRCVLKEGDKLTLAMEDTEEDDIKTPRLIQFNYSTADFAA